MKNENILVKLYSQNRTVFSLKELGLMFSDVEYNNLKRRVNHLIRTGKLLNPTKGVYAKIDFNEYELVGKLYVPSYISLETVLAREGVIFQAYETIFAVSYLSREVSIDKLSIVYRKIGNKILANHLGVEERDGYYVASRERAFTDTIYLNKNYHFDNLTNLNWDTVFELCKIYKNKAFKKRIDSYYQLSIEDNV